MTGLNFVYSQQLKLSGVVKDSIGNVLAGANIIAIPQGSSALSFATTDEVGGYRLKINKGVHYAISASYIGYKKFTYHRTFEQDTALHFILQEQLETLDEIIIEQPVIVKKDTIEYKAESFAKGDERKLRTLLKRLPGVEVDRAGNVRVQGKRVKKFLVEGKPFFTGDPKLGVNNIPANAIDKIQMLDNHSDVAFLKGLEDSDDMAMNIKLKKERQRFLFGDIEVGGGDDEQQDGNYLVYPSVFYYSSKTKVNLIADWNNTGSKSFTMKDFIAFEGGLTKLLSDAKGYFNLYQSELASFLENSDYQLGKQQFGALHIDQELNAKTNISVYGITVKSTNEMGHEYQYDYLLNDTVISEARNIQSGLTNWLTLGKLSLTHENDKNSKLQGSVFTKYVTNNRLEDMLSSTGELSKLHVQQEDRNFEIDKNLAYHKRVNSAHVFSVGGNYKIMNQSPYTSWFTTNSLFPEVLNIVPGSTYTIVQNKAIRAQQLSAIAKHYWILNDHHHLYSRVGGVHYANEYMFSTHQQLQGGVVHDVFQEGNDVPVQYRFNDFYFGLQYKMQYNKLTVTPGLSYHWFQWNPGKNRYKNRVKGYFLPAFKAELAIKNSEKITLNFESRPNFAAYNQLVPFAVLSGFNRLFRGNSNLENELSHLADVSYTKYSLFRGLFLNAGLYFTYRPKVIQGIVEQNGLSIINSLVQQYLPQSSWRLRSSITKKIDGFSIGVQCNASTNYSEFIVNSIQQSQRSDHLTLGLEVKTRWSKKYPEVSFQQEQSYSFYKVGVTPSQFVTRASTLKFDHYFLKRLQLKTTYEYTDYRNKAKTVMSNFSQMHFTINYNREDAPFQFGVSLTNALNTQFKRENSMSSYVISDRRVYVLPRMLLLRLVYKI